MSRSSRKLDKPAVRLVLILALAAGSAGKAVAGAVVPPPVNPLSARHLAPAAALPAQVQPGNVLTPGAVPPPPPPVPASLPASNPQAVGTAQHSAPVTQKSGEILRPSPFVPRRHPTPTVRPAWRPPFQRTRVPATHTPKTIAPSHGNDLVLSNTQLNILRFNQPIRHIWFPANTPLVGKPAYFAQDHAVMLQFEPGVDQTAQAMIELADGAVLNKEVVLQKGPGAVIQLSGASGSLFAGRPQSPNPEPKAPDTTGMSAVRLLQSVVQGIIPEGFTAKPVPMATPFQEFLAQPVALWQDSNEHLRVFVFELQGKTNPPVRVAPPEFYRPGVEAVLLTTDTVGQGAASPFLYVVEAYHGE